MPARFSLLILVILLRTGFAYGQGDSLFLNPSSGDKVAPQRFIVTLPDATKPVLRIAHPGTGMLPLTINGDGQNINLKGGSGSIRLETSRAGKLVMFRIGDHQRLVHFSQRRNDTYRLREIPMWLSVLPPLLAIGFALLFKEVIVSLFVGIWAGAFIAGGLRIESFYHIVMSLLSTVEKYIVTALTDAGHLSVIIFSLLIGGMVAIISKNGGMAGVVKALSRYANSPRSAQLITWLLGVAIFFDDYANTLIVGNTMRSVTDRFRVSREKLAYVVDSTAAPVAAIAFITTWIGAELGYIEDGIHMLGADLEMTSYAIFIQSLKYSFYPFLTLMFILFLAWTGRDYGPMYHAEKRARATGQVTSATSPEKDEPDMEELGPVKNAPLRWYNAVIPVLTVILMTIFGLVQTGMASTMEELVSNGFDVGASWSEIWAQMPLLLGEGQTGFFVRIGKVIGNSDSFVALLWASLAGVVVAIALTIGQRIISLFNTMHFLTTGFKTMMPALIILTLAWSLAITTEELHTADYITSILRDTINPYFMPAIVFVLAAFISFSTGSSWSTMAILYPIAIPTTWAICMVNGFAPDLSLEILLNVISTVLAASVLGDHCSPISDTTILSSLASDCNHIDHVRTQLPYALTVGLLSLVAGTLATLLGGSWLISFLIGIVCLALLLLIVVKVGRKSVHGESLIANN